MENAEELLKINDLTIEYHSNNEVIHAVNHVSFDLAKGGVLGLVGETGAGKTTIAKAIMQILPSPQGVVRSGEIIYEGADLLKLREKETRKIRGSKISMIFQDPMTSLNPVFTIGDQIMEGIRIHEHISAAEATKRAVDILELVGIPGERFDEYPHQFSGGMKQRVSIAIALACNPELLIADEPTTALDVTIQAQVLEMMKGLRERLGTSMLLITHDLGVIAAMCTRVAVVYAGEIVEIGSAEDIFDRTAHPYTIGLFNSLPDITRKNQRLQPIPGMISDPVNLPSGCKFHERCSHCTQACQEEAPSLREITPGHFTRCPYM